MQGEADIGEGTMGREQAMDTVWIDTGSLGFLPRMRLAWAVLSRRPVELRRRSPLSDTVFPLDTREGASLRQMRR